MNYNRHEYYKSSLPIDPRQDDIYIGEFPKSGITWLSFIIGNIFLQIDNKNEFMTFFNHTMNIYEIDTINNYKMFIGKSIKRRIIKTHSFYNPYYLSIIYMIRNPFDVMISYYNFSKNLGYEGDFAKFVKHKKYGIYAWKNHVDSWTNQPKDPVIIHLLKYEDLIEDTFLEIKNIILNLGININDDIIKNAIKLSSIENMKYSEEFYRKYNPNYKISFVGKHGKISKEELLTNEIKRYILKEAKEIIERFYPSLLI